MGFSFSFKPRFVNPIRAGLGLYDADHERYPPSLGLVKRQTIRAERKDGKRPAIGDELHLFTAMRTRQCQRIVPRQIAFVHEVRDIEIAFGELEGFSGDRVTLGQPHKRILHHSALYLFAKDDGFADWRELRAFWAAEHPGVNEFKGFITFWEGK